MTNRSPRLMLGFHGPSVEEAQRLLNGAGARPPLRVDGEFGPLTDSAVRQFQERMGLEVDGIIGARETWPSLRSVQPVQNPPPLPAARSSAQAPHFAAVTRAQAPSRFGAAGSAQATQGLVVLPFPMPLAWDLETSITRFRCNRVLEEPITWVFEEAARHYGESEFRSLHLDRFAGCFFNRRVRNGTAISIHAYGAAVDTDSARNGNRTPTSQSTLARPEYAAWWRIVEASGALSFGKRHGRDWMHWSYVQE